MSDVRPLPHEFLDWQVKLRLHTMEESHGAPHAGVAPLLTVTAPHGDLGVSSHAIICGLLPREDLLEQKTKEFRALYEEGIAEGARTVYDRGIDYLKGYYRDAGDFDRSTITTLLPKDLPVVHALRARGACALTFYVFDLAERGEIGRFRCLHMDGAAEVLEGGPVYDNVWWHNTLFHGAADDHVVIQFRHAQTHDTRFGRYEPVAD